MMEKGNLKILQDLVFESDNTACFIERERCLCRLEKELASDTSPDKHARVLATLLSEVSTPVLDCDLRVVIMCVWRQNSLVTSLMLRVKRNVLKPMMF